MPQNRWPRLRTGEMGVAKCVCCCRRVTRAGASNRWWDSWCGQPGEAAWVRVNRARNGCERPQIGADDVNPLTMSAFELPDHLTAKADPALIAGDDQHFAAIAASLEESIADLSDR